MDADYLAIGHVTVDLLPDGTRRPGGTVLYGALQASRLGLTARIVTRGVPAEIESLLAPFSGELELQVQPAAQTTTLGTSGQGEGRRQRMLSWAGPIRPDGPWRASIVHLAPVARELPQTAPAAGELIGLTPQGLVRSWGPGDESEMVLVPASAEAIALAGRCDALVLSEQEHASCAALLTEAEAAGAVIAITAGPRANTIFAPAAQPLTLAVEALEDPVEDLGAGDVYASSFFVALHEGRTPGEAGAFAGAAATLRMTGAGADAIARREAIEARSRMADAG